MVITFEVIKKASIAFLQYVIIDRRITPNIFAVDQIIHYNEVFAITNKIFFFGIVALRYSGVPLYLLPPLWDVIHCTVAAG